MNLILKIDKPCKESLDRMNDIDGGKFCITCSKKVLDFSQLQGSEIKKIFHENKEGRICGILSKNHLNKAISENISSPEIPLKRIRSFTKITAGWPSPRASLIYILHNLQNLTRPKFPSRQIR